MLQRQGKGSRFVIEGELELTLEGEAHLLKVGNSFYFASDLPHANRSPGQDTPARSVGQHPAEPTTPKRVEAAGLRRRLEGRCP